MKKIIQFLQSVKGRQQKAGKLRKTRAQSLVEFAITLPVLILLFSGLVEFGFALNFYLSLLDATREAARYAANWDPFTRDPVTKARTGDDMTFYSNTALMTWYNLDPKQNPENAAYRGRRIILDPANDGILVTVYSWSAAGVPQVVRYPTSMVGYSLYHTQTSRFNEADIATYFERPPGDPNVSPNAGLVVVEVHYNYHQKLAIPYLARFVPNPLMMRAYTIMPLSAIR